MALPRINDDKPIYELTLPTSGKKIKYRPFLVREQKNILIASESESSKESILSMIQCIEACAPEVNIKELSTAEVDFVFLHIRSKSVGEKAKVNFSCTECETPFPISVDLTKILIEGYNKNNVIELNDTIKLKLKYTTYQDSINNIEQIQEEESVTSLIFKTLKLCLHSLEVNEELIMFSDESDEEIDGFLNSLNPEQLEKCLDYVKNLPKLNYETNFICEKCNHNNEVKIQSFEDFF